MMMTRCRHGYLVLELVVDDGCSPLVVDDGCSPLVVDDGCSPLAVDDGWSPLSASFEWPVSMVKCFPLCNIRKSCHIFQ